MAITTSASPLSMDGLVSFAENLGEALGRGVVRGMNAGLTGTVSAGPAPSAAAAPVGRRRPGRPPKAQAAGPVSADKQCKVEGCTNPSRSKGLCSKHYQAERRRIQAKA